jgi:hypothetical protein
LTAQRVELNQVSAQIVTLQSSPALAAAAGGDVVVTQMETPSEPDEQEEAANEADVADPPVVDVVSLAAQQAASPITTDAV